MQQEKYKWDLSKFCANHADCESRMQRVREMLDDLVTYRGKLNEPSKLKEFWEKSNEISTEYERCLIYAYAGQDTNYGDTELAELCTSVSALGVELNSKLSWEGPELKSLGNEYLAELKTKPEFKEWKLSIDKIMYNNDHTLSEAEEKILAEVSKYGEGFRNIFQACYMGDIKYKDAVDSEGKTHKINTGNAGSFRLSADRVLRKSADESINEALKNYGNIMAQNLIHYFTKKVTLTKIKKYDSVLDAGLGEFGLSKDVYNNVIDNANKNLDIQASYYKTKKKLLNLDIMYNYDIRAPILNNNREYTFEEGIEIIKNALSILGEDYTNLIDRALTERWVDVYPADNKANGGYCWGTYGITHIILMNWTGKLDDVFTLAHELGHAIQHYYNYQAQQKQNTDMPIFLAETASTFNEILLYDYLIKNTQNKDEKIELLDNQMADIIGVTFAQTNMSRFEDYCYTTLENNGALTLKSMQEKWIEVAQSHIKDVVTYTTTEPLGWENIWHFYNKSYYVWQYTMAHLISTKMADDVINDRPQAIQNYMEFLKNTNELNTTEFMLKFGIDINSEEFYKNGFDKYREIYDSYDNEVDEYLEEKQFNLSIVDNI